MASRNTPTTSRKGPRYDFSKLKGIPRWPDPEESEHKYAKQAFEEAAEIRRKAKAPAKPSEKE